jgi:hypothetical protein
MNINYNYININKGLKFLIFLFLLYLITSITINNYNKLEKTNSILIICTSSVVIYYILDQYFPSCNL